MELEKFSKQEKQDDVNIYTELFSKKEDSIESVETESNPSEEKKVNDESIKEEAKEVINQNSQNLNVKNKFSDILKRVNVKNITIGFLIGIIANISYYHYDTVKMQAKTQRLANGLMYNLAETNDLNQIATNIYLGMKESGWEPVVKISNDNIFVFVLEGGGEFTITKSTDIISTKFHVSVKDFSKEMIKSLSIQTEGYKMGGTKMFISNKNYYSALNEVTFDLEKIGSGTLPDVLTLPTPYVSPNVIPMPMPVPPLPNIDPNITSKAPMSNIDPQIIMKNDNMVNIPVSDELNKNINKDNDKNTNQELTKKQKQDLEKLTNKYIEDSKKVFNAEKKK